MPADGLKWIVPGWYRIEEYHSNILGFRFHQRRIYIGTSQRATVVDKHGQQWYELPTPRGLVFMRLTRDEAPQPPCRCPRFSFPHRRTRYCTGDYDGQR